MVENTASETEHFISCRKCGHEAEARFRVGPFGLQTHKCARCGQASTFPLSRGWRIFWWVVAAITAVGSVTLNMTLAQGYSWIPGGLGLVAFVALFIDIAVRQRLSVTSLAGSLNGGGSGPGAPGPRIASSSPLRAGRATPSYVATLTSLAVCAVIASLLGAAVVIGLNNGYDVEVVLQEAQPASQATSFDGTFDFAEGDAICGGGEDYYGCIEAHRAMYNALCTDSGGWRAHLARDILTSRAWATCEQLLEFVTSGQERLEGCGYGCTTRAEEDGTWGWRYLHPVPHQSMRQQAAARPAITYTDRCWFSLGPIELGRCEHPPADAAQ